MQYNLLLLWQSDRDHRLRCWQASLQPNTMPITKSMLSFQFKTHTLFFVNSRTCTMKAEKDSRRNSNRSMLRTYCLYNNSTHDLSVEVHKLSLSDAAPRGLHLLLSVLVVLVQQIHSGQGQHHERPHQARRRRRSRRHFSFTNIIRQILHYTYFADSTQLKL